MGFKMKFKSRPDAKWKAVPQIMSQRSKSLITQVFNLTSGTVQIPKLVELRGRRGVRSSCSGARPCKVLFVINSTLKWNLTEIDCTNPPTLWNITNILTTKKMSLKCYLCLWDCNHVSEDLIVKSNRRNSSYSHKYFKQIFNGTKVAKNWRNAWKILFESVHFHFIKSG